MGLVRFLLAFMVAYSHTNNTVFGCNTGVFAVIGFYIISGFVMTALCSKYYNKIAAIPAFYADRLLRIYPQYAIYTVLGIILIALMPAKPRFSPDLVPLHLILNFLIIPNDFWVWLMPDGLVLTPTWSLGLEALFYLAFPLIFITKVRYAVLLLSAAFFLLPYFNVLDTDIWGYRELPGTLFMFLAGSFIYSDRHKILSIPVLAVWVLSLFLLVTLIVRPSLQTIYNFEVLLGNFVFLPVIWMLRHQPSHWADRLAGNLSYGMFLNHVLIIWILQGWGVVHFGPWATVILLLLSVATSVISYRLFERPFLQLRHGWLRMAAPLQKTGLAARVGAGPTGRT